MLQCQAKKRCFHVHGEKQQHAWTQHQLQSKGLKTEIVKLNQGYNLD